MSYFKDSETECRCGCRFNIRPELLAMIDTAREAAGMPFTITSGARCSAHNAKIGGKENSSHLRGLAVDIAYGNSSAKFHILRGLYAAGFRRIGDNPEKSFIHCDIDPDLPQNVFFKY